MPYNSLKDLPDSVKDNLPHHAQEIFKEAFNSASEQYDEEETAFKVAWSAVKNEYEKNDDDEWVRKEED
ncbi:ChaB family protein [Mesobacillus subterraneus]|uniref:ChaB family protein n=1 Tax=Mesobacillus subterraneus TaxID=285983 RepID=UPI001CFECBFB|nr:ChaB family protein [Mesobacillus subterraneus]WLR57245.1 ChaB family protein [Mesobacillus subterraneus]